MTHVTERAGASTSGSTGGSAGGAGIPAARRQGAFTLIELLVVVSIMIILMAVSVPLLSKLMQSNKLTQGTNLVTAYTAQARALAVQYKRPVAVVFYEQTPANAGTISNANQTAVMIAVADANQAQYSPATGNTVFVPASGRGVEYMPAGIKVAVLDDTGGVRQNENTSAARTRAIVFDSNGQLLVRNGLATAAASGTPGSPARVVGDWNFALPGATPSDAAGVSSPGLLIYDGYAFTSANNGASDAQRSLWLRKNADIVIVNAFTGNVLRFRNGQEQ